MGFDSPDRFLSTRVASATEVALPVRGYAKCMTVLTASKAKVDLDQIIDQADQSHAPIVITGKRANAVLIAEEDWNAIQETLYLVSIPGMRESILEGMRTTGRM